MFQRIPGVFRQKNNHAALYQIQRGYLAQSLGFEPRVGYQPTHDFQSCALDHSANSASSVVRCSGSTATMTSIYEVETKVKG